MVLMFASMPLSHRSTRRCLCETGFTRYLMNTKEYIHVAIKRPLTLTFVMRREIKFCRTYLSKGGLFTVNNATDLHCLGRKNSQK